ncbi:MAG: Holliday junction branch migration protein RuvA [Oscillospiraceae bacterium]|nr:Holliday junction branch migration protein RuvA [Oscillospiraceae bacterium]
MFYSITGTTAHIDAAFLALDVGGVAFKVLAPRGVLNALSVGEKATLYTHMLVRDDALELCGFSDLHELETFRKLLGVTGVGAKVALAILSELGGDKLALSVAASDAKSIQASPGVGAKLAQRIVLELKGKLEDFGGTAADVANAMGQISSSNSGEALEALCALGYSRAQSAQVLATLDANQAVDTLIRQSLQIIMKAS